MLNKRIVFAIAMALCAGSGANAQQTRKAAQSGYLGIYSGVVIEHGNIRDQETVTVQDVFKGSPADKAGIKRGDEILRINGMDATSGKFRALAATLVEGDTVKLHVRRDGKELDITIVAEARPASMRYGTREVVIAPDAVRRLMLRYLDSARVHLDSLNLPDIRIIVGDSGENMRFFRGRGGVFPDSLFTNRDTTITRIFRSRPGLPGEIFETEVGPGAVFRSIELGARSIGGAEFTELDPAMSDYFKADKGLLTLRVAKETPAGRAGLQPGDVVLKANDRTVLKVSELRAITSSNPDGVKLEILRKGERKMLELKTRAR